MKFPRSVLRYRCVNAKSPVRSYINPLKLPGTGEQRPRVGHRVKEPRDVSVETKGPGLLFFSRRTAQTRQTGGQRAKEAKLLNISRAHLIGTRNWNRGGELAACGPRVAAFVAPTLFTAIPSTALISPLRRKLTRPRYSR